MTTESSIIAWAEEQARSLLLPLGERWLHTKGVVVALYNLRFGKWAAEARPTTAGVKLVQRAEQGLTRHDIHIDPRLFVIPIGVPESRLGCGMLSDVELHWCELLFELCRGRFLKISHKIGERGSLTRLATLFGGGLRFSLGATNPNQTSQQ